MCILIAEKLDRGVFAVLIDDFVFNGNEQLCVVMDGKCSYDVM